MRGLQFAACLLSLASCLCFAQQNKLALVGGLLIDGTGGEPLRNSIVLVDGDRIEAVGAIGRLPIPRDYQLISTEGMTLMPGLWDSNVHLVYGGHPDAGHWLSTYAGQFATVTMPASARQLLAAGVTSVRDLAVNTRDIMAVREKIADGELPGPTIYTAGTALVPAGSPSPAPHLTAVGTVSDAIAKTRALVDAGVDFITVKQAEADFQDQLNAIVTTAHDAGIRVTADARLDEEIRVALRAGVDEIQHIGVDTPTLPEDILDMIEQRIARGSPLYWNPAVGAILNADELAADPEWLDDPKNFVGLTDTMERDVRRAIAGAEFPVPPARSVDTVKRKLQSLGERGVIMVFGSGEGNFGQPASEATWRELEAWVFELGMDPLVALKWATNDAAAYMGVADRVGTVTPGKLADIIAVRGSPLRHFSTLRDPVLVIKHGKRFK